jgi:hypothetical protein
MTGTNQNKKDARISGATKFFSRRCGSDSIRPFMTHKLFHTAAWLYEYIKVSRFFTTQSRLDFMNVADETKLTRQGFVST